MICESKTPFFFLFARVVSKRSWEENLMRNQPFDLRYDYFSEQPWGTELSVDLYLCASSLRLQKS